MSGAHPPSQSFGVAGRAAAPASFQLEFDFPIRLPQIAIDELEANARKLLCSLGAKRLSENVRVEWNARLRSAAGRADSRTALVSLNPRLQDCGEAEIDRTLRHELAHLLAQARAARRRISPHGTEWREACRDLGIEGEGRCHTLPFPVTNHARRFIYRCPRCGRDFLRVRQIRRATACLACCRRYNHGKFHRRFQLRLVQRETADSFSI